MNVEDLTGENLFTTSGKDVWRIKSFCLNPSCKLENLETKEIKDFGLGGLTSQSFIRINMPKI